MIIDFSSSLHRLKRLALRLFQGDVQLWSTFIFRAVNTPVLLLYKLQSSRYEIKGLISVITPTVGNVAGLAESIASLDKQTSDRWDQVIIADGFFKGFWEIFWRLMHSKKVALFVSWPTRCYGNHQRNVGMLMASGEWLIFLDDDNILYPHAVDSICQILDRQPDLNWILMPIRYDSDRHDIHTLLAPSPPLLLGQVDTLNLIVRRQHALRVGGWINSYTADFSFLSAVTQDPRGIIVNTKPIGHHR